jgi:hypothetical protein
MRLIEIDDAVVMVMRGMAAWQASGSSASICARV